MIIKNNFLGIYVIMLWSKIKRLYLYIRKHNCCLAVLFISSYYKFLNIQVILLAYK